MKKFTEYIASIFVFSALILLTVSLVGCTVEKGTNTVPNTNPADNTQTTTPNPTIPQASEPAEDATASKYSGKVLAGQNAPYIEFNSADYDAAVEEGKIIFLYFYSSQSGQSLADQKAILDAFNKMTNSDVIGFRVNIDDDDTSAAEFGIATTFEVKVPRIKLIIKDGKVLQRTSNEWNANDYVRQLTQYIV